MTKATITAVIDQGGPINEHTTHNHFTVKYRYASRGSWVTRELQVGAQDELAAFVYGQQMLAKDGFDV